MGIFYLKFSALVIPFALFIGASAQVNPFVTKWEAEGEPIVIPTNPSFQDEYNYDIKIYDESRQVLLQEEVGITTDFKSISFSVESVVVEITGDFPSIFFNYNIGKNKILSIEQWGDVEWKSMERSFYGCINLIYNASDTPNLDNVTNMGSMFFGATSFNGDLSAWNVCSVENMESMFAKAASFNGDLSNWDVSSVISMDFMFREATSFNGDLSSWDVSSVINMGYMFSRATSFNGDLSNWNVSSVTNMFGMFFEAISFNSDLSSWDVGNVTNMGFMFHGAYLFNGDLSGWNLGNVTDMQSMLDFTSMSTKNYDKLIWALNQSGRTDIRLGAQGLTFFTSEADRNELVNTKNWLITGDVLAPIPPGNK